MILVSWVHEKTRRSTFILQKQLEEQVSTTKRAQLAEREAADSKRKLTSYMCASYVATALTVIASTRSEVRRCCTQSR